VEFERGSTRSRCLKEFWDLLEERLLETELAQGLADTACTLYYRVIEKDGPDLKPL